MRYSRASAGCPQWWLDMAAALISDAQGLRVYGAAGLVEIVELPPIQAKGVRPGSMRSYGESGPFDGDQRPLAAVHVPRSREKVTDAPAVTIPA